MDLAKTKVSLQERKIYPVPVSIECWSITALRRHDGNRHLYNHQDLFKSEIMLSNDFYDVNISYLVDMLFCIFNARTL